MPDEIFDHPRLAALYDIVEADRSDLDAYEAIADELAASAILDVGCGTGCLALRLSETGRRVVGLDPALASLEVARAKPGADQVTWVHGPTDGLPAGLRVDLVTMTGNVAQVFLDDEEWLRTLGHIADVVEPGGHLVFETRRPAARAWEDWAQDPGPEYFEIPGTGRVRQDFEVTKVNPPLVSFRYTYTFESDGEVFVSDSTLRFRDLDEVRRSLAASGFDVLDVRDAPDRPEREFVVVAQRSDAAY